MNFSYCVLLLNVNKLIHYLKPGQQSDMGINPERALLSV